MSMSTIDLQNLMCIVKAKNIRSHNNNEVEFETQQTEHPHKWEKPIVTYAMIRGTDDLPEDSMEVIAMNLAMTTWDFEIDLTLQVVKKNENPDITLEFSDSENDEYFKDRPSVLAYAYYPKTSMQGVIKFCDDHLWSLDGKPVAAPYDPTGRTTFKTYNMLHTLIHEIGHSLGLTHSEGTQYSKTVMYPFYNEQLDLDEYDIERIIAKYGSRQWSHPIHYTRMKNWLKIRVRRFGNPQIQSQEVNALKNQLENLKNELTKKDVIIMEQIKVIMDLARKLK
jgi:hypothetical protein